jgi:hypothetical protein
MKNGPCLIPTIATFPPNKVEKMHIKQRAFSSLENMITVRLDLFMVLLRHAQKYMPKGNALSMLIYIWYDALVLY